MWLVLTSLLVLCDLFLHTSTHSKGSVASLKLMTPMEMKPRSSRRIPFSKRESHAMNGPYRKTSVKRAIAFIVLPGFLSVCKHVIYVRMDEINVKTIVAMPIT